LNAYNFPNPFNLKSKTLTLSNGGSTSSLTTTGTILRYDLPSSMSGTVIIRIYTLSGDLVDELEEGSKTGGFTYYSAWDGKNKDGQEVASGVYFAVFDVAGKNAKDQIVKLVVLK
jgi:flagellar hook assembly protein FlgD